MSLDSLYLSTITANESDQRTKFADLFAEQVEKNGVGEIMTFELPSKIINELNDFKNFEKRIGAIMLIYKLHTKLSYKFEPYMFLVLPQLIERFDDKVKTISYLVDSCLTDFFKSLNPYAASNALPYLFTGMSTISWKIKVGCLKLLGILAHTSPTQIGNLLPHIVPKVTENMWDTKPEVKSAAKSSLGECCTVIHNPDVKPIVSDLIHANANPKETVNALDKLMGTTFVSQVDRPTLAIIVPLLNRGLRERDVQTKRKCCVVIDNMCKLVCSAQDVEPFVEKLLPELKRVEEEVPIPEIREYGARAKATLIKAIKDCGGVVP